MENENIEKKELNYDDTPVESTPKKKMPKGCRIALFAVGGVVGFLVLAWAGLNIFKYPYYHDFYKIKADICEIPGYNSEPTAQGCTYDSELDAIYTTAYTSGKAATIYTVTKEGKTLTHKLYKGDKEFTGHVGGIATSGNLAYIANDDKVYTVPTSALHNEEVIKVDVGNGVGVNNQASFIFCNDKYIWVGEFHDGTHYITNNVYGENHAIIEKYDMDDFALGSTNATPLEVISIMNKVQGFTVTSIGTYVFSTSYGLADSYFYMYDKEQLKPTTATMHGTTVYAFEGEARSLKAPAMMEDLDIYKDGTVMTLTEAGSNKYVFGKFFFANHILSLNIK